MSRRVLAALLAACVLSLAALVALAALARDGEDDRPAAIVPGQGPFRGGSLPAGLDGKPAPRFRLADVRGGSLDSRGLRGRPYVLTFLYTDCQDVCPLIGREVGEALHLLGAPASKVAAVAVSVDPEHDTSAAVRAWLRRLRLPGNFHYLVGARQELEPVWRAYFAAPQPLGVRESKHTASIWLIDARGRLRTEAAGALPVRTLTHAIVVDA
jgi:protein SCO1